MKISDFCYVQQGKQIARLQHKEAHLLLPIELHKNPKKERALLMLHGFGSTPGVFRLLIQKLNHYDTILAPTLAGHGLNLHAFSISKAKDWVASAEKSCRELVSSFAKVDVLGLSLGGLLAYHLQTQFPLHHLYLLAPAFDLHININTSLHLARTLEQLGFKAIKNRGGDFFGTTHAEITYTKLPLSTIVEVLRFILTFPFSAPTIPTDVFLGQHDKVVNSEEIALRFRGKPHQTVHWLTKSAHILPLDGDIDAIAKRMADSTFKNY
jgi:carboxylesterase